MERKLIVEPVPVVYTIPEAARRLRVSTMTIRRLLERGELEKVSLGRSVRVLGRSVEAFAERGGCARG